MIAIWRNFGNRQHIIVHGRFSGVHGVEANTPFCNYSVLISRTKKDWKFFQSFFVLIPVSTWLFLFYTKTNPYISDLDNNTIKYAR